MYNPKKFKFGNKTTTEIENLSNRVSGDSVYDTQRYKRDFYDGSINLNQDMISLTASTNVPKGYGVRMTTTGNTINLSINAPTNIGVAVQSAATNSVVAIAVGGIYSVYYSGSTVRTLYSRPINVPSGQSTGTTTASAALSGIILQNSGSSGLVNTFIISTEKK